MSEPVDVTWRLLCDRCGERFALAPMFCGCPKCMHSGEIGVLDLECSFSRSVMPFAKRVGGGLARYRDLLPGGDTPDWVTLGEGGTPLIKSRHIGPSLGLSQLYFKNEGQNPTGSFKDRFVAVTINFARAAGFSRFVTTSTGNLGVSVAAYCAAANVECVVVVPTTVSPAIRDELRRFGARVVITALERRVNVFEEIARSGGYFPVFATFRRPIQNPFGIEGYKTFAYEIVEQLQGSPNFVVFPCARGNGLHGAWKGFRDCLRLGWTATAPAMVASQPIGSNSLEVSLMRGANHAVELPRAASIAKSTAEVVASDQALASIRESGGLAVSASDGEIAEATNLLLQEGLSVEPSAALAVAGVKKMAERQLVSSADRIVCILTATGLRWPIAPPDNSPEVIELHAGRSVLDLL